MFSISQDPPMCAQASFRHDVFQRRGLWVSCSVLSDSLQPHRLYPTRLLCHGIFQAMLQEWIAVPSPGDYSRPRDWIHISCVSCIGRRVLNHCTTWEAHYEVVPPPFLVSKGLSIRKVFLTSWMKNIWYLIFYLGSTQPPLLIVLILIFWGFLSIGNEPFPGEPHLLLPQHHPMQC